MCTSRDKVFRHPLTAMENSDLGFTQQNHKFMIA